MREGLGNPGRRVVPAEEFLRRRENHERGKIIVHAEFAECVRANQGDFRQMVKVGESETILSMRLSPQRQVFCFAEANRVFVIEDETVKELPPQDNALAATISIASPAMAAEAEGGTVLSRKALAEVAETFQQVMIDSNPGRLGAV